MLNCAETSFFALLIEIPPLGLLALASVTAFAVWIRFLSSKTRLSKEKVSYLPETLVACAGTVIGFFWMAFYLLHLCRSGGA